MSACTKYVNPDLVKDLFTKFFLSVRWWTFGLFLVLAIVNNAAICIQAFMWRMFFFISLGSIPKNGIAGSYGNSIILRNCQTVFCSTRTTLHSHPSMYEDSNFSTFLITLVFPSIILIIAIWAGVTMESFCGFISLIANDVEHRFMCLLTICFIWPYPLWGMKCLFRSFTHF